MWVNLLTPISFILVFFGLLRDLLQMRNDYTFDDPTMETFEDVDIDLGVEPIMEYILTSKDGFTVCDLTLITPHSAPGLAPFQPNIFHSVFQVDPFNVKRSEQSPGKEITSIGGDTHERICIIDIGNSFEVDAVCDLAIKRGAKALIVKDPPKADVSVPVFLVSTSTMEKMTLSEVLVNIQQKTQSEPETTIQNAGRGDLKIVDGSESVPIDLVNSTASHPILGESDGGININQQVHLIVTVWSNFTKID